MNESPRPCFPIFNIIYEITEISLKSIRCPNECVDFFSSSRYHQMNKKNRRNQCTQRQCIGTIELMRLLVNVSGKVQNQNRAIKWCVVSLFVRQQHRIESNAEEAKVRTTFVFSWILHKDKNVCASFASLLVYATKVALIIPIDGAHVIIVSARQEWVSCEFSTSFRSQMNSIRQLWSVDKRHEQCKF